MSRHSRAHTSSNDQFLGGVAVGLFKLSVWPRCGGISGALLSSGPPLSCRSRLSIMGRCYVRRDVTLTL